MKGIPDFLPYSLITNSTFNDNLGSGQVMSMSYTQVEMRETMFKDNKMLGTLGTTVHATETKLFLKENVKFISNEGVLGGALRMNQHSSLISHGVQFISNVAHEQGGAIMLSEAYDVTLRKTNFTSNRSAKIASVIFASNGHDKTNIVAEYTTFSHNYAK